MKKIKRGISLPEGRFETELLEFEKKDKETLAEIYKDWLSLSDDLQKIGARRINLPEGLSESATCLALGIHRFTKSIAKANTSFDAFDINKNERIQIKACSVLPDLTSFGPKSVWDKLYFVDFYRNGKWDGTFDIYHIENKLIYNHKVNKKQTLQDQQKEGRRPRFSIYKEIIQEKNIKPIKTGKLF
jgi:hypothetical protein